MASGKLTLKPVAVIKSSINADDRKTGARKTSSSHWWAPLFGFSSNPDYVHSDDRKNSPDATQVRTRFTPCSFTDEKAKQLRRMTTSTPPFHDMYHSAIASRLASDFTDRSTRE